MSSRNGRSDPPSEGDRGNLIGALLRLSHQAMMAEVFGSFEGKEFSDILPVHMTAMRPLWDAEGGVRATELAVAARITKQSMGAIVEQLEDAGYVERVDDPADGRAKLVRLTRRGREAGKVLRAAVRRVEADWARRVGAGRLAQLRDTLADLVASLDRDRE